MIETLTTAAISLAGLAGLAFMYGVLIPDQNKRISRVKKELQGDIKALGRNQRDLTSETGNLEMRLDNLSTKVEKHENTYKALTGARRVARRTTCGKVPDRVVSQCCKCGQKSTLWRFEVMNVIEINKEIELLEDKSDISDGSHTFEELYHHRAILFSIICNTYKNQSWKSWKHDDGTMFEDYFVVGVTTEQGEYSYHYHKDYWKYFEVKELTYAPVWDGHKPSDIERLFTL